MSSPKVQVVGFGHSLSEQTKDYILRTYGDFKFYKVFIHLEDRGDLQRVMLGVFKEMAKLGVDMDPTHKVTTLLCIPGSTPSALALQAAWFGVTQSFPDFLNVVRVTPDLYAPHPTCPVYDMQAIKNSCGRQIRSTFFHGVEEYKVA